jgi:hypothetical protein
MRWEVVMDVMEDEKWLSMEVHYEEWKVHYVGCRTVGLQGMWSRSIQE